MTKPQILQILALADTYEKQAQTAILPPKGNINQQFQAQRERLENFFKHFVNKFRAILNEINGDIFILKERGFDPKWIEMIRQLRNNLEDTFKTIDETQPYLAAYELVDYVLDRPRTTLIDNLNFFIEHHLQQTQPQGKLPPFAIHAQVSGLKKLQDFCHSLKIYMDNNPLLPVPIISDRPREPNPAADPSFLVSPDQETNAPITKALTPPIKS